VTPFLEFHADHYAGGSRQPAHAHDEVHLSLVLRGQLSETVGTATVLAGPLSVVLKDAGVVHADTFGAGGATIARVNFRGGGVEALMGVGSAELAWRWSHHPAVAAAFLRLVQRAVRGDRRFPAADPDLLDLLAAIMARPASASPGAPPRWLREAMAKLRGAWHPRLAVSDIARDAGVHPVYLARCVRRWYGHGVRDELCRLRLAAAAGALAGDGGSVSEVAHRTGFADQSHLCREFRRSAGVTPGGYRAVAREVAKIQAD
jgi:AraC family transcriptional regulator